MVPNGFYKISYGGSTGSGFGMLALNNGAIVGIDEAAVEYDGEYGEDDITGAVHMRVNVKVPANTALVVGAPARSEPWTFLLEAALPPNFTTGIPVKLRTRFGSVEVTFTLMRSI